MQNGFVQPKIILIGNNGQIGWELRYALAPLGQVIALGREQLDLANPDQIRRCVREIKPDIIVNAAAYTAVDKAEEELKMAIAVNSTAPGILAEEAKRLGALIVHYSTDFIFDGKENEPYVEEDIPNPLNVYGRTKLEGENAIRASGAPHLILRVSWVYGTRGNNFMLNILRLAQERKEIKVVDDQIGSPTWCRLIAGMTSLILARDRSVLMETQGIYHLTAGGQTSRYGFAKAILERSQGLWSNSVKLIPVRTKEFFTKAKRPAYTVLSNDKLCKTFGLALPEWDISLDIMAEQSLAPELSMRDFHGP